MSDITIMQALNKTVIATKNYVDKIVLDYTGGKKQIYLTQSEYDLLSDTDKNDNTKVYNITDAEEFAIASGISIEDTANNFTSTNVEGALSELFQFVSNGKTLIASAVTDKGVATSNTDTFQTMATNIRQIVAGGSTGTYTITYNLNNVTSTNTNTTVNKGGSYTTTLLANDGYILDLPVITVDGIDVTTKYYSNGTFTINNAFGNIVITSTATYNDSGGDVSVTAMVLDNPYPSSVLEDATLQLTPVFIPDNATNQNVTWATSNSEVATVDNGLVTGVSEGTCEITATSEDGNIVATSYVRIAPKTYTANTMPALYMNGNFDGLTSSASEITLDSIIYKAQDGSEIFYKKALCSWQGNTSIQFPEKNYSIDLLELDGTSSFKYVLFDDVAKNDGYHLKANYVDISHARNISVVNIMRSWRKEALPTGARGCIDGYPILVYLNGNKHGVYTFNLKQHGKTVYGMNKANPNHLIYRAESNVAGLTTSFRALSTDNSEAGAQNKDWEDRFPKTNTAEGRAKLNRVIQWVMDCEGNITKFANEIGNYFNKNYLIDYWIACQVFLMTDSLAKNMSLATYDGNMWYILPYDCDGSLGNKWNGTALGFNSDLDTVAECKDSLLWELVVTAFADDIKARYAELRSSKLTKDNVVAQIKVITDAIPAAEYEFDKTKWSDKPGQDSGINYMTTWIENRLAFLDTKYGYTEEAVDIIEDSINVMMDLTEAANDGTDTIIATKGNGVLNLNNFTYDNMTNGFMDGGLQFNGSSTYATMDLTFQDDVTFTVGFTKKEAEADKWNVIVTSGLYSAGGDYQSKMLINTSANSINISSDNRGWGDNTSSTTTNDFIGQELTLITIVKEKLSTKVSIYINNRFVESSSLGDSFIKYDSPLYVGARPLTSGKFSDYGKFNLKYILVYDKAMTMAEVMHNHTALQTKVASLPDTVERVSLNKSELALNVEGSETLIATIIPTSATNKNVIWSCDNSNCTLIPNGLNCVVKGVSEGSSIITITTEDGGFTDTCNITVNANDKIVTTTRYAGEGSFTEVSEGVYKLTNTSAWDKLALCGDVNEVPPGDYNICIKVLERDVTNIDGTTAKIYYQSTYSITSKAILDTNLVTCDLNTTYKQQVTIKNHTQTGNNARIALVQFNNSNTGDYITVKLWLETV